MEKRKRPPLPLDASPQEKYDNLILTIYEEWQECDGQFIHIKNLMSWDLDTNYYGFINSFEFAHYINSLIKDGLLDASFVKEPEDIDVKGARVYVYPIVIVSFLGIKYCHSLLESGKNSNKCFVAMAFKEDMERFYDEAIFPAIEKDNLFRAIRIDREHTENEQTINDFIIASIKQSKFCIADLTYQRNGVYFEAGYALGRGLKVIYTCRRDDFANVHFDLKTMQTILYSTPEELRHALNLKIQAVIL